MLPTVMNYRICHLRESATFRNGVFDSASITALVVMVCIGGIV